MEYFQASRWIRNSFGKPCLAGTRTMLRRILGGLASGASLSIEAEYRLSCEQSPRSPLRRPLARICSGR